MGEELSRVMGILIYYFMYRASGSFTTSFSDQVYGYLYLFLFNT